MHRSDADAKQALSLTRRILDANASLPWWFLLAILLGGVVGLVYAASILF